MDKYVNVCSQIVFDSLITILVSNHFVLINLLIDFILFWFC